MTAEFVAEARRVYVPTAKWARANGAKFRRAKWSTFSDSRWIKDGACVIWNRPWLHYYEDSLNKRFEVRPTSIRQALDYLVAADVLPEMFHGLSADLVQVLDESRASVFQDDETGEIIHVSDGDQGPEGNGLVPLLRRGPAGSVTT